MRRAILTVISAITAMLVGLSAAVAEVTIEGDPKIAFIYFSQANDGGWSEAHERGRQKTAAALGVDIPYVENVEETTEAVRQVVDLYVSRGFNIIVGTSYGFGDGLLEAAKENPGVAFVNVAGETAHDNLETFYARTYQAWYLAGMAAGGTTTSNKIGIVGGFPISVVNWDLNAFARGAQSVNPDVEVIASFVNTWYDPVKERQAAEAILEQGADVMATNVSSTAVVVAAEAAGAHLIGFQNDMSSAAPKGHLTSVIFNWEAYYVPLLERIKAGKWSSAGLPLVGFEAGDVGLADITPLGGGVTADLKQKITATRRAMIDGSFHPYAGPVTKQSGEVVVPAGATLDEDGLWGMNYFVEGVTGTMPE